MDRNNQTNATSALIVVGFKESGGVSGQPAGRRTGLADGYSNMERGRDGGRVFRGIAVIPALAMMRAPAGFRRGAGGLMVPERRAHG